MENKTAALNEATQKNIQLHKDFIELIKEIKAVKAKKSASDSISESQKLSSEISRINSKMNDIMRHLVVSYTNFAFKNKDSFSYPRQYDLCGYKSNRYVGYSHALCKVKSKCGSLVASVWHDHGEGNRSKSCLVIPRDFIYEPEEYIHRIQLQTVASQIRWMKADIKKNEDEIVAKKSKLKLLEERLEKIVKRS